MLVRLLYPFELSCKSNSIVIIVIIEVIIIIINLLPVYYSGYIILFLPARIELGLDVKATMTMACVLLVDT